MTSEPGFVFKTLAWCNERRAEQGKPALKKLPKGRRSDGTSCPCGKATGLHVALYSYGDPGYGKNIALRRGDIPGPVTDFIRAFDGGLLPQYEAKS